MKKATIIVSIILAVLLALAAFLLITKKLDFVSPTSFARSDLATNDTSVVPPPLAVDTSATRGVGEGKRKYSNANFRFSLLYPENLVAKEYTEQGGALAVTFEDPHTYDGFQIYVTPYAQDYITPQRFKSDEPSGVIREQTDAMVGGVRATTFFGKNALMDDTREVWFVHSGNLFEVTTYKDLDVWLGDIMQTWQFL